jgi:hypothetical protein
VVEEGMIGKIAGLGEENGDESLQKWDAVEFKAHEGESVCDAEDIGRCTVGEGVSVVIMENGSVEGAASG